MDPVTTTAVAVPVMQKLAPYLIQAGGSLLSQIIGNRARRREQDREFKFNTAMWEKQNEYNSPVAQQQRIREAGLNPALMYGQGSTGNATTLPQYQAPRISSEFTPDMNPLNMMKQYLSLKQDAENISMTQEQIKTQIFQTWLTQASQLKMVSEARLKGIEADFASATFDSNINIKLQQEAFEIAKTSIEKKRAEWAKMGLNPNDATWLRLTAEFLKSLNIDEQKIRTLFGSLPHLWRQSQPIIR